MKGKIRGTTMILNHVQIAYLDRLGSDVRAINGVVVDRSQIVRALIDSLAARGINAAEIKTDDDLRRLVA